MRPQSRQGCQRWVIAGSGVLVTAGAGVGTQGHLSLVCGTSWFPTNFLPSPIGVTASKTQGSHCELRTYLCFLLYRIVGDHSGKSEPTAGIVKRGCELHPGARERRSVVVGY